MVKLKFLLVMFMMITVNITISKLFTENELRKCSDEHQKMIQILKRCFQNTFSTIIAKLDSNECVINFLEELPDTLINLVTNDNKVLNRTWLFSDVPIYVLEVNSAKDLQTTLTKLESLEWWPWWDRENMFFLIENSNNSCIDAKKILHTMWTEKLLSTIYVCHDYKNNIDMIFTYNPFTNRAPKPWKLSKDNSHKRWALYERRYRENGKICLNLMFDKAKYLDGYEIKSLFMYRGADKRNSSLSAWISNITIPSNSLLTDISRQLNISISVKVIRNTTSSILKKIPFEVQNSEFDLLLNSHPSFILFRYKTYPFFSIRMNVYIQKRPFLRPEEKIQRFFLTKIPTISIIILLLLISPKILQINKKQTYSKALLKILQSVLNVAIKDFLKSYWIRFYFLGMFLFFILVTESFKGHLAAFLTKPERIPVDTIKDLTDLRYHIYIPDFFKFVKWGIIDTIPKKYIHYYTEHNCAKYIDTQTACLTHDVRFHSIVDINKLHVLQQIMYSYEVWIVSPKFPFKKRIDEVLSRYSETGIIKYWYHRDWHTILKKSQTLEDAEVKAQFRPIELDDLLFAFKFLGIGLFFSFIYFIMEIGRR